MSVSHEAPVNLQEQLALDDSQLAMNGIARSMELAQKAADSAEWSLNWARNYVPSAPAPDPGYDRGSLDHQDWVVESYRESDEEVQEDLDYRSRKAEEAEDVLNTLFDDKEAIAAGEEDAIGKYARQERERIQAEIAKQEAAKASKERYEAYKEGSEVEGSNQLADDIKKLISDPVLIEAHRKTSNAGWKYEGHYAVYPDGKRNVFTRSFADGKLPYNKQELLSLEANDKGVTVQYSGVDNIDETAVSRYGRDIATGEHYSFVIHDDGKVGEQKHTTGSVNKHLPHLMDNGTVSAQYISDPESSHSYGSTDLLTSEDMTAMQAKIKEVADAMTQIVEQ